MHASFTPPPPDAAGWAEALERTVIGPLGLAPRELPPHFAGASGRWKGEPVTLTARAYQGPTTRYARVCTLRLGPRASIGNLILVPRPERLAGAIFGMDAVELTPGALFVAADVSPMLDSAGSSEPALPAWAARWFSPQAVLSRARVSAGEASREASWRDVQRALERYLGGVSAPAAVDAGDDVARAQQRYLDDHRTEDRTLTLLSHLFGPAWGEGFLAEVLFPARLPR